MEYNTVRDFLAIREYGRNVKKMVTYLLTVEDREKRTQLANSTIKVMSQLNTASKDTQDYWHKLWDHLYILSDFKLEVDSPYPMPESTILTKKPDPISYPKNKIRFRHYGKTIERMIAKACLMDDGEEKQAFVSVIGNHLKKLYITWNRDSVNDELIFDQLALLSGGRLRLDENSQLTRTHDIIVQNNQAPADTSNIANRSRMNNNNNRKKSNGQSKLKPYKKKYQQK
ncbi:MAG: DUF4290 domain-containing protein [Bacteroidota bacterium]